MSDVATVAEPTKTKAASTWNDASCDLWLVADAGSSIWSRRLDWYLNFQAMRSERYQPHPSLKEGDLSLAESGPLLIASQGLLPCSKTVFVAMDAATNDVALRVSRWVDKCVSVWRNFSCPRVRVFLPDKVSAEVFLLAWQQEVKEKMALPDLVLASDCPPS